LSHGSRRGPDSARCARQSEGYWHTIADIAAVIAKISQRVIRTLRRLGYLEMGIDAAAATGYGPLRDDAPELVRTLATSVQQCIAFGEGTGQKVRRIGSGFGIDPSSIEESVEAPTAVSAVRSNPWATRFPKRVVLAYSSS
jgi:hypothetical protein